MKAAALWGITAGVYLALQWGQPTERWILKTPNHLWCLETLLEAYQKREQYRGQSEFWRKKAKGGTLVIRTVTIILILLALRVVQVRREDDALAVRVPEGPEVGGAVVRDHALAINPKLDIVELSCKTGEGFDEWVKWIRGNL